MRPPVTPNRPFRFGYVRGMSSPSTRVPYVLAIGSILATPFLLFAQFFAAWIDNGEVLVLLFGASSLVLPILAFVKGRRAGTTFPQVIGGILSVPLIALQAWGVISWIWPCTLFDGC